MGFKARITAILAMLVAAIAAPSIAFADFMHPDSCLAALEGRQLDPIEGLWQFPDDGARLLIARQSESTFGIYLISSPRLDIQPGIMIGRAVAITPNTYDATLSHGKLGNKRINSAHAEITLSSNGTLSFRPYGKKAIANMRAWFSLFFLRLNITARDESAPRPAAKKVYPLDETNYHPCL